MSGGDLLNYYNKKRKDSSILDDDQPEIEGVYIKLLNPSDLSMDHALHPDNIIETFSKMLVEINSTRKSNGEPALEQSDENNIFIAKEKDTNKQICKITETEAEFTMPAAKEFLEKYLEKHADYKIVVDMCDIKAARELAEKYNAPGMLEFSKEAIEKMSSSAAKGSDDEKFIASLSLHAEERSKAKL